MFVREQVLIWRHTHEAHNQLLGVDIYGIGDTTQGVVDHTHLRSTQDDSKNIKMLQSLLLVYMYGWMSWKKGNT